MATKATERDASTSLAERRPFRPFLTGFGLAAAWGAFHLPHRFSGAGTGEFAAEIIAAAILSGGTLALVVEAGIASIAWVRRRFRRSISTVA